MDLDEKMRNLEKIKQQREEYIVTRLEKQHLEKQKFITDLFFKNEMQQILRMQQNNKDKASYAFYAKNEGKDHFTRRYKTTIQMVKKASQSSEMMEQKTADDDSQPEKEFMVRPNTMEYFYEERETSERVFAYHRRIHLMWRFCTYTAVIVGIYAFYQAKKREKDMWEAAEQVVQRAESRGASAQTQSDGSIEISIDGKLVDVIPKSIAQL